MTNKEFIESIKKELKDQNNKLSYSFIQNLAARATVIYIQPTPSMRLCVLQLESGHEVLGKAQVLDSNNDLEEIGNKVAYTNAVEELWATIGNIAKVVMND